MKTPSNILLSFCGLVGLCLLVGCQSSRLDSYVDTNYSAAQIKRVVVLPMANASISAGHANELSRSFAQALSRKNASIQVLGAAEAIEKINQAGLAEEWATFLRNFASSGIPDTSVVRKVGQVLNVNGIIQGTILNVTQKDSDGYSYPVTRVSVRYSMIGADDGRVMWELTGEGVIQPYSYTAAPIIDAVKLAHQKIIAGIP